MRFSRSLASLFLLVGTASTASAQEAPAEAPAKARDTSAQADVRAHSVNLSPLGPLSGTYSVNYEHLFGGTHGLLVEGLYSNTTDKDTKSNSAGASVGYRWHWSDAQDSGFIGMTMAYETGTGTAKVTTNGESVSWDVDVTTLKLIPNIGRRWAWDSGFNITFRFGIGYAKYDVSTDSDEPGAKEATKLVDDLLTLLPVGVDGELSVGWIF